MLDWEKTIEILKETINNWAEAAISSLPNLVVAISVFFLFCLAGLVLRRTFEKLLQRSFDSDVILRLISTILQILVICFGIYLALGILDLQRAALSMLAGAGVIGIALGFAFQDAAENFIAGIVMGIRKPFKKGDLVETHDRMGYVQKLNLRNTILENFDGQRVIIPNKEVFQNTLINYQMTGKRRVEFEVGVAYSTDLEKAIEVARGSIQDNLNFIVDGEAEVLAKGFANSSISLLVRYWIEVPGDTNYFFARSEGVQAIHRSFKEEGIVIPFPIRTLEFGNGCNELVSNLVTESGASN